MLWLWWIVVFFFLEPVLWIFFPISEKAYNVPKTHLEVIDLIRVNGPDVPFRSWCVVTLPLLDCLPPTMSYIIISSSNALIQCITLSSLKWPWGIECAMKNGQQLLNKAFPFKQHLFVRQKKRHTKLKLCVDRPGSMPTVPLCISSMCWNGKYAIDLCALLLYCNISNEWQNKRGTVRHAGGEVQHKEDS